MKNYLLILIFVFFAVPSFAEQQILLESSTLQVGFRHLHLRSLFDSNNVKANANYVELYEWGPSTGFEAVDEGNGIGWRLISKDPDNFGNIGNNAVDVSSSSSISSVMGATGENSYSEGNNTIASGDLGSHSEGSFTIASGDSSHAEGSNNEASGNSSHVEGDSNVASGQYSHAEGLGNVAAGDFSHSAGRGTVALNYASYVLGKYNLGTSTETIVEVGIGGNIATKANAFEIYLDGRVRAPGLTLALHNAPSSLTTKEYVDSKFINKTPATQTEECVAGEHAWDTSYIYVCTANNYWKRTALSAW